MLDHLMMPLWVICRKRDALLTLDLNSNSFNLFVKKYYLSGFNRKALVEALKLLSMQLCHFNVLPQTRISPFVLRLDPISQTMTRYITPEIQCTL